MRKIIFKSTLILVAFLMSPCFAWAATYFSNDFNTGTEGLYFVDNPNYWTRMTSGGVENTPFMRLTYSSENVGTSGNQMQWSSSSSNINQFWIKLNYRIIGTANGGSKFLKFFGEGGINGANNMTLIMDYGAGVQTRVIYYNDTICEAYYSGRMGYGCPAGSPTWTSTSSINAVIQDGQWHTYKAYVKRATSGQANGELVVFSDGIEVAHITNMASNPTEVWPNSTKFVTFSFGDYTNSGTHVSTWALDMDNIIVSDSDPDASSDTTPPASPTGLSVS